MSDDALEALATQCGLLPRWSDVFGRTHDVAPDTLRAALASLDIPANSASQISQSASEWRERQRRNLPPLVTATTGRPVELCTPPTRFKIVRDTGECHAGTPTSSSGGSVLLAPDQPGYHPLTIGDQEIT